MNCGAQTKTPYAKRGGSWKRFNIPHCTAHRFGLFLLNSYSSYIDNHSMEICTIKRKHGLAVLSAVLILCAALFGGCLTTSPAGQ